MPDTQDGALVGLVEAGGAPQSGAEVADVLTALRRMDPLLGLRWNPKAVLVARGSYSVLGQRVDAQYAGRWQVIRFQTPTGLHAGRDYTVICTVTEPFHDGHGWMMQADGPYGALGLWLVEYMQRWDAAQAHFAAELDRLWAEHDAAEATDRADEQARHQEGAERIYHRTAGSYWMGRGFGAGPRSPGSDHVSPLITPAHSLTH